MRQNILIRTPGGIRRAGALVLGEGLRITETAGGLPELESTVVGEPPLMPSGGDDTQAIQNALGTGRDVRLGPGNFTISQLTIGADGKAQRLSGSGLGHTSLSVHSNNGPVIRVQSGGSVIEGFVLTGSFGFHTVGIQASNVGGLALRNLSIFGQAEAGIHLENVASCEISNVTVSATRIYGIYARSLSGAKLWNLYLDGGETGLHIENGSRVVCESAEVVECTQYGIRLVGGTGYRLAAVRADHCRTAIALDGNTGAVVGESLLVTLGTTGILVDQARDVALNGCRVVNAFVPLVIRDSENVVACALASESTRFSSPQHIRVERSAGVFFTSTRVVNGTTPPTHEVDVSQAGSPVLFGPNNFDMTRINSGGNFARICHS